MKVERESQVRLHTIEAGDVFQYEDCLFMHFAGFTVEPGQVLSVCLVSGEVYSHHQSTNVERVMAKVVVL